jgi:hypothetical protein
MGDNTRGNSTCISKQALLGIKMRTALTFKCDSQLDIIKAVAATAQRHELWKPVCYNVGAFHRCH